MYLIPNEEVVTGGMAGYKLGPNGTSMQSDAVVYTSPHPGGVHPSPPGKIIQEHRLYINSYEKFVYFLAD